MLTRTERASSTSWCSRGPLSVPSTVSSPLPLPHLVRPSPFIPAVTPREAGTLRAAGTDKTICLENRGERKGIIPTHSSWEALWRLLETGRRAGWKSTAGGFHSLCSPVSGKSRNGSSCYGLGVRLPSVQCADHTRSRPV
ncbi:hypothetical protein AAFF_G00394550 [Aldrovandia affinis]|uniref:Uncharacterized protein n=1 Tax=Aldrovandia affinis TaxID=143900 RepID=A0AAD7SFW2_9TELE|nr:hypothetical protein AAFF_G00394550 [Aldrovandia affinis]